MAQVLLRSASFVAIIALGYLLKRCGMFAEKDAGILSKIVMNITLPAAIVLSFAQSSWQMNLLLLPLLGVVINLAQIGAGWVASRRMSQPERYLYMFSTNGYNIGAFGLPFVQSFFGPAAVVAICLFGVGNGVLCTGACYGIVKAVLPGEGERFTLRKALKEMFSTLTFSTYLVMIVLTMLDWHLPQPVLDFLSPAAAANSFVAMMMVGLMFEFHPRREYITPIVHVLGLRLILSVCMALAVYWLLPMSLEIRQAMAVVAFAPGSVLAPVYTGQSGGNAQLAGCISSCSIVVGVAIMVALLSVFGLA